MENIRESQPIEESEERKLRFASESFDEAASISFTMFCIEAVADWAAVAILEADCDAFANCPDARLRSPDADERRASSENGGIDEMSDRDEDSDAVESEYNWRASDREFIASYAWTEEFAARDIDELASARADSAESNWGEIEASMLERAM